MALIAAVHAGELDIAIAIRRDDPALAETLLETPMVWIGRDGQPAEAGSDLPLVLFEAPCTFRSAALDALARGGRGYRIRFTSPSLSGLRSAVAAGLGATVRTRHFLHPGLADIAGPLDLPGLPTVTFAAFRQPSATGFPAQDDLLEIARRALNGRPL